MPRFCMASQLLNAVTKPFEQRRVLREGEVVHLGQEENDGLQRQLQ